MTDSTSSTRTPDARRSGVFEIPGVGPVHRLGYGAMRITGPGIWGEPADRGTARDVVRRAVELGVDFIDTADSYGPEVSEQILREALHPYPEGLVIATKAGLTRTGPDQWHPVGRPEYLRQQCELSLRRLGVEAIDLFQLHRIDPQVDRDDQLGLLRDLLDEGKVRAVGLSQVSVEDIRAASSLVDVATVQNRFNLTDRTDADVLEHCAEEGIGFIPWAPVSAGELARPGGPVDEVAQRTGASASQVALAWLLQLSPVMLPIPGTGSVDHLEDNLGAAGLELSEQDMSSLTGAA